MNCRDVLLSLAFLFTIETRVFAHDKTDVLVMKNGDHMTCEVKGLDAGVLMSALNTSMGQRLLTGRK